MPIESETGVKLSGRAEVVDVPDIRFSSTGEDLSNGEARARRGRRVKRVR
jgi:hypothetical protein